MSRWSDAPDRSQYQRERRLAGAPASATDGRHPHHRAGAWARSSHVGGFGDITVPTDEKKVDRQEDVLRDQNQRPTTGRNTKLGRKVEKPMDPKAGGPSGQKDKARHDKKHANK